MRGQGEKGYTSPYPVEGKSLRGLIKAYYGGYFSPSLDFDIASLLSNQAQSTRAETLRSPRKGLEL